jgi:phosphoribosylanthranilate isomerase
MTKVKICGITNIRDAHLALDAGADMLGFIFYPKSRRYVTPKQVRAITAELCSRPLNAMPRLVGVFVDRDPRQVTDIMTCCNLDDAQLHGRETPETVTEIAERGFGVIKAFRVRDARTVNEIAKYRATAYLLDAYAPNQLGGTGHSFDWSLAIPAKKYGRIVLAGGLSADNVNLAIKSVQPWGVDVSSGIEISPGLKDPQKLIRFIQAAKGAYPDPL